ncbi:MAG: hypothetical protein R6U15_00055 [Candidatus Izemoplasmatales bacterium]
MATLQDLRLHNFIGIMPILLLLGAFVLWYLDKKLDKRVISQFLVSVYIKIIYIPLFFYAPYWFTFSVGDAQEIYYIFMLVLGYLYYFTVFFGIGITFIYGFEFLFKNFMGVEIYLDGLKIKWGKFLKK